MKWVLWCAMCLGCIENGNSQSLNISKKDSATVLSLNAQAKDICSTDIDSAILLSTRALNIAVNFQWDIGIARSENSIGWFHYLKGDNSQALFHLFNALKKWDHLMLNSAVDRTFTIERSAGTLGNIGVVFWSQDDFEKALNYLLKALDLSIKVNDSMGVARHYGNIGNVYVETGEYSKAMEYYRMALTFDRRIGNVLDEARQISNVGLVYYYKQDFDSALVYLQQSLHENEMEHNNLEIGRNLGNIGSVYFRKGDLIPARDYADRTLTISLKNGDKEELKHAYKLLYMIDSARSDHKNGLFHFKMFITYSDSLSNEENTKKQTQTEMQYEFDKKTTSDSIQTIELQKQENMKHENEIKRQRLYTFGGIGGFLLMLVVAIVSIRAYSQKQKANLVIAHQKSIVEEKQKEILDSIRYAKRIQSALLPNESYMEKTLKALRKN